MCGGGGTRGEGLVYVCGKEDRGRVSEKEDKYKEKGGEVRKEDRQ